MSGATQGEQNQRLVIADNKSVSMPVDSHRPCVIESPTEEAQRLLGLGDQVRELISGGIR